MDQMHDIGNFSRATPIAVGEWAGWLRADGDPFNAHVGPFYQRDDDGRLVCSMRVEPRHLNGGGGLHGGALATFADYCLFAFAGLTGDSNAVTIVLNCDFVGAAALGERLECRGEEIRSTGSMIFLRGLISRDLTPVMSFSGILKKVNMIGR
jgi:uncharacterized protein (TIGR00369 family)